MDGTIILTGASGGLGQGLVKKLLQSPGSYNLIFPVRNKNNAHAVKLRQMLASHRQVSHTISMPEVDLACFDSIRAFVSEVNDQVSTGQIPSIRALILNAATFFEPNGLQFTGKQRQQSPFEMHFAVNYLANVLLSLLLLGSIDRKNGRIVFTSSWAHDMHRPENKRFRPDKLQWNVAELAHPDMSKRGKDGDLVAESMRRYGASKLALVTFMHALRKRLDETPGLEDICIVGVDPGAMVHENLIRKGSLAQRVFVVPIIVLYTQLIARHLWPNGTFRTVMKSAQDLLQATLESNASWAHPKDAYFNGSKPAETAAESKDAERQRELWELSLRYVELEEGQTALASKVGETS